MKKHLIATAVAAAVSMPAVAQVTLYGTIDVGVATANKTGTTAAQGPNMTNVQSNLWTTNRWGFRGTEDLGGGLKANFGVESSYDATASFTNDIGNRGAFVGASGGFGEVRIGGRMSSLVDTATTASVGSAGNFSNLGAHGGMITYSQGNRPANSIVYETPTFNGVRGQLVMGRGEGTTAATKSNNNYQSAGLTGKVGALSFTAVRATNKTMAAAGTATRCVIFYQNSTIFSGGAGNSTTGIATGPSTGACATDGTSAFTANGTSGQAVTDAVAIVAGQVGGQITTLTAGIRATGATDYKTEETAFSLGYDFGMAQVTYMTVNQKTSGNLGTGTTSSSTATLTTAIDRRVQGITLVVPMGNLTPFLSYQEMEDKVTTNGSNDVDATAVGVNYALSKRTNAYAVYSTVDRGTASTVTHRGAGATGSPAGQAGTKSTGMAIGLRHSF